MMIIVEKETGNLDLEEVGLEEKVDQKEKVEVDPEEKVEVDPEEEVEVDPEEEVERAEAS